MILIYSLAPLTLPWTRIPYLKHQWLSAEQWWRCIMLFESSVNLPSVLIYSSPQLLWSCGVLFVDLGLISLVQWWTSSRFGSLTLTQTHLLPYQLSIGLFMEWDSVMVPGLSLDAEWTYQLTQEHLILWSQVGFGWWYPISLALVLMFRIEMVSG